MLCTVIYAMRLLSQSAPTHHLFCVLIKIAKRSELFLKDNIIIMWSKSSPVCKDFYYPLQRQHYHYQWLLILTAVGCWEKQPIHGGRIITPAHFGTKTFSLIPNFCVGSHAEALASALAKIAGTKAIRSLTHLCPYFPFCYEYSLLPQSLPWLPGCNEMQW